MQKLSKNSQRICKICKNIQISSFNIFLKYAYYAKKMQIMQISERNKKLCSVRTPYPADDFGSDFRAHSSAPA
jgi:hypothetical protein